MRASGQGLPASKQAVQKAGGRASQTSHDTSVETLKDLWEPFAPFTNGASVTEFCRNPGGVCLLYTKGKPNPRRLPVSFPVAKANAFLVNAAGWAGTVVGPDSPELSISLPSELFGGRRGRLEGLHGSVAGGEPSITIRFPPLKHLSLKKLIESRSLTKDEAEAIVSKANGPDRATILIAGPTDSGKTTLGNALGDTLTGRLIVIEDTPELQLKNSNTVYLETKPRFSMADAIKASLRMRPDRIVIGELRDGEAVQNFLNSAVSGHPGFCTLHATADTVVSRLYGLVVQATGHGPDMNQIYQAIDLVVEIRKEVDGEGRLRRRVTKVGPLDRTKQIDPALSADDERARDGGGRPRAGLNESGRA